MTRNFKTATAPHVIPRVNVPLMMRRVLYALVPAACIHIAYFGAGLAINFLIASVAALFTEAVFLRIRRPKTNDSINDGSALVTAALLCFALPPFVPGWIPAIGGIISILAGKQIYGGLGRNVFNPAMVGYAVLLVSFPAEMTQWLPAKFGDLDYRHMEIYEALRYAFTGTIPLGFSDIDAVTRATPLDVVKEGLRSMQTYSEIRSSPVFGDYGGRGWEWINNLIGIGGLYLLIRGVIRWHIPIAVMAGVIIPATIFYLLDASRYASPGFHLFSGATILGAFFIATDPVTAAASNKGRLFFGAGVGFLTYAIRVWGGYPDGMAFAILLMNGSVPIIDRFTRRKIYGH